MIKSITAISVLIWKKKIWVKNVFADVINAARSLINRNLNSNIFNF